MNKFNIIWPTVEEKLVKSVVVYGKTSDTALYVDEACSVKLLPEEAMNLCLKQMMVICYNPTTDAVFGAPVVFSESEGTVSVVAAVGTSNASVTFSVAPEVVEEAGSEEIEGEA